MPTQQGQRLLAALGFAKQGVHKVTLGVVMPGGRTRGPCCALKPDTSLPRAALRGPGAASSWPHSCGVTVLLPAWLPAFPC